MRSLTCRHVQIWIKQFIIKASQACIASYLGIIGNPKTNTKNNGRKKDAHAKHAMSSRGKPISMMSPVSCVVLAVACDHLLVVARDYLLVVVARDHLLVVIARIYIEVDFHVERGT